MNAFPASVRSRILLRSLAVQGSWNYETLIGAGFAFTVLPALRYLYRNEPERLEAAIGRHVELFNSHPYLATIAVGAVSRLEAEGVDPATIHRFKTALRGSLGSLGDRLVWTTWRPMSMVLGLAVFLAGAPWWAALLVFLVVYNSLHLWIRLTGLRIGSESGLEVGRVLREVPLQRVIGNASKLGAVFVGTAAVLVVGPNVDHPLALALGALGFAAGVWLGFRTRRTMIVLLTLVVIVSLFLGATGHGT